MVFSLSNLLNVHRGLKKEADLVVVGVAPQKAFKIQEGVYKTWSTVGPRKCKKGQQRARSTPWRTPAAALALIPRLRSPVPRWPHSEWDREVARARTVGHRTEHMVTAGGTYEKIKNYIHIEK